MEGAVWKLEEKWNLTTQKSLVLFACTLLAVIGLCSTAAILKRKCQRKQMAAARNKQQNYQDNLQYPSSSGGMDQVITIRKVLMGSMRWSERSGSGRGGGEEYWEVESSGTCGSTVGCRQSHNSVSAVWQRPILMGEKCELPRHSGLILYDERGKLLDHSLTSSRKEHNNNNDHHQEKTAAILMTTTLRDLFYY